MVPIVVWCGRKEGGQTSLARALLLEYINSSPLSLAQAQSEVSRGHQGDRRRILVHVIRCSCINPLKPGRSKECSIIHTIHSFGEATLPASLLTRTLSSSSHPFALPRSPSKDAAQANPRAANHSTRLPMHLWAIWSLQKLLSHFLPWVRTALSKVSDWHDGEILSHGR